MSKVFNLLLAVSEELKKLKANPLTSVRKMRSQSNFCSPEKWKGNKANTKRNINKYEHYMNYGDLECTAVRIKNSRRVPVMGA